MNTYTYPSYFEQINRTYFRGSDSSIVITGTMGLGLSKVLINYLNEFEGTKMLITHKMLFRVYEPDLKEDSVLIKNPEKLIREDISIYTPDLLVVDWHNRTTRDTKYKKVIKQIASQAKRVIIKKDMYDPTVNLDHFAVTMLDRDLNIKYATKEIECQR